MVTRYPPAEEKAQAGKRPLSNRQFEQNRGQEQFIWATYKRSEWSAECCVRRTMRCFLLIFFIIFLADARKVQIKIRENVTQSCPNVDSDIIDESSLKISMKMLSTGSEDEEIGDEVSITDINGETKKITFPGCYRVKVSFRMLKPIKNPHIEAFMQLGQNVECRGEGSRLVGVAAICANITDSSSWCPQSQHTVLRDMLNGKHTCRFCQLCENMEKDTDEVKKIKKFVSNEGREECSTEKNVHKYSFKMCTPTRHEIEQEDGAKNKIEEYWHYLKQVKIDGVLTTIIHVMDRSTPTQARLKQCTKLCDTLKNGSSSKSYKSTLNRSIQSLCAPVDTYAACLYHTVKFDVNSDM